MPPTDSPAVVPPNYDKIFKGYSYVAPSVLFTKNVISDEILKPAKQHDSTKLINCKINNSQFFQTYDIDLNEPILGDGTFSVCRRCVNLQTGKEYAVKIVSRKKDCSQEINLLRACQGHSNVVSLHDVIQDEAHTYLVLEYLKGGELFERIRKKSKFTESEASGILRKLVSAVSFMHSRGVVHRDLKPENLVFTSENDNAEIKVIDFGFARLKQEKESLHTPCFTLHYAAPEVLKGDPEGYDENCDLWSLGVILYTMLCGKAPFHARSRDENVSSIMGRIKEGDFNFNSPAWNGVSNEAKSVVRGLLTVNPSQRLRMNQLETNSWVQGSQNFISTPLMTPDILLETAAEKSLQTTFNAFHKAQREGFRLQDVLSAKLAQRRRMKKSSSDNNSTSSSSFTSEGSLKSGPKLSLDVKKTDGKKDTKGSSSEHKDIVFNFGENRVTEFLQTMSSSPLDPETVSPSNSVHAHKNSIDTKVVKKRQKKVYIQTRKSERIRRKQRQEIDLDPISSVPLSKNTRKRKVDESEASIESSASTSKRKKATVSSCRKTKKNKINR
ncbi:Pkinase and/or Kdo domain containing protein [Asbolus verrucosus]|uniref:Pkinase and/or Kdo domain containing protein n=1 Tax=Asbolus verrucosus TaxID=1661398 RepID=A0A482VLE0_ASBVE|nr:Pkinase and/or Kdo domain containing protein [Asbolus verrucosus]